MVNRISEAEQERLGLFTEEMGEAQLEIGKILRHGIDSRHPDDPTLSNAQRLELEAGHVLASIELLVAAGTFSWDGLHAAKMAKLKKLRSWVHAEENLETLEAVIVHDEMLRGAEAKAFVAAVNAGHVEALTDNQRASADHAEDGCDAPNIGIAESGLMFCCHCGWNEEAAKAVPVPRQVPEWPDTRPEPQHAEGGE